MHIITRYAAAAHYVYFPSSLTSLQCVTVKRLAAVPTPHTPEHNIVVVNKMLLYTFTNQCIQMDMLMHVRMCKRVKQVKRTMAAKVVSESSNVISAGRDGSGTVHQLPNWLYRILTLGRHYPACSSHTSIAQLGWGSRSCAAPSPLMGSWIAGRELDV